MASYRPRDSSFFRDLKRDLNYIKKALLRVLDPLLPLLVKRNAPLKIACQISLISALVIGALYYHFITKVRRAI
ncbi:hypothetical protein PZA11_008024 [Diplocarpon coronariae]